MMGLGGPKYSQLDNQLCTAPFYCVPMETSGSEACFFGTLVVLDQGKVTSLRLKSLQLASPSPTPVLTEYGAKRPLGKLSDHTTALPQHNKNSPATRLHQLECGLWWATAHMSCPLWCNPVMAKCRWPGRCFKAVRILLSLSLLSNKGQSKVETKISNNLSVATRAANTFNNKERVYSRAIAFSNRRCSVPLESTLPNISMYVKLIYMYIA